MRGANGSAGNSIFPPKAAKRSPVIRSTASFAPAGMDTTAVHRAAFNDMDGDVCYGYDFDVSDGVGLKTCGGLTSTSRSAIMART